MKAIQHDKAEAALVVSETISSPSLDVGGMGPECIAAQVSISNSSPDASSAQMQGSIDGSAWFDLGSPVSITANGVLSLVASPVYYRFYRVKYTTTATKAALVNQSLTYTAVQAGKAGEDITIALINPGAPNSPLSIQVAGTDIIVNLATDAGGIITSTGNAVKTAINADPDASALVLVSGTNASVLSALAETPLAGADGYFTATEHKLVYGSRI